MDKNKIKIENILKIKKHKYFNDSISNCKQLNKIFYSNIVKLMTHAMLNKSLETLLIIDENFKSRVYTSNDENNVNIPSDIIEVMNNNTNNKYIMMHNHPSNSNFSIKDLSTFISRYQIAYLVVVTNDCQHISVLGMHDDVDISIRTKMLRVIEQYCNKYNKGEHSSAEQLIQYFQTKGLLYAVYKNY